MRYMVKEMFTDLMDGEREYQKGDIYPREGLEPSEDRIKELSTTENKRGLVLIEAIDEPKKKAKVAEVEEVEEPEDVSEEKKPVKKAKKK